MVPFSSPSAPWVPFVVSGTTNVGDYLDFTLCGSMTNDWRPGGKATLTGLATVYPSDRLISEIAAKGVEFHVGLDLLFDANGQGHRPLNNYFSTVLTPTDLPVEHSLCCYKGISEASITADSFKLDRSSGRITAPFTVSVPIPPNVPPGPRLCGSGSGVHQTLRRGPKATLGRFAPRP
jgi:hypothetical protein